MQPAFAWPLKPACLVVWKVHMEGSDHTYDAMLVTFQSACLVVLRVVFGVGCGGG
jgi:hypothetical protein